MSLGPLVFTYLSPALLGDCDIVFFRGCLDPLPCCISFFGTHTVHLIETCNCVPHVAGIFKRFLSLFREGECAFLHRVARSSLQLGYERSPSLDLAQTPGTAGWFIRSRTSASLERTGMRQWGRNPASSHAAIRAPLRLSARPVAPSTEQDILLCRKKWRKLGPELRAAAFMRCRRRICVLMRCTSPMMHPPYCHAAAWRFRSACMTSKPLIVA